MTLNAPIFASRLNQQPSNHGVGDRNLVNIAPLQLGQQVFGAHGFFSDGAVKTEWLTLYSSLAKRGSLKSGSSH